MIDIGYFAPTDCRWRSLRQILHLKYHVHVRRQLDPFRIRQAQHLIIVEDGVQILDPNSVYGAVAYNPLMIFVGKLAKMLSH